VPCGQLTLSEDGAKLSASTFAYGLRYLQRPGALEVDPVALSLRDMDLVRGTALFPPNISPCSVEFAMQRPMPGAGGSSSPA